MSNNDNNNEKIIVYMKKQEDDMRTMREMLLNAQTSTNMLDVMKTEFTKLSEYVADIKDTMNDNAIKVFGALNTETAIRVAPEAVKPRLEKLEKEVKELTKWKTKLYAMTAVIGVIAPILISLFINWLSKK